MVRSVSQESEVKVHGGPSQTLATTTVVFFTGLAAVGLFGPAAVHLKELLKISPMEMSWLIAAPNLSGSLLRIPFGAWAGYGGGRRPMLVLLSCAIVGMACLYLKVKELDEQKHSKPGDYSILLGLAILIGCGIASFAVGVGQISYWFPKDEQGRALGLFGGLGNLAPAVISLVLPYALKYLGLPTTYLIWLVVVIAATLLYAVFSQDASYFQLLDRMDPDEAKERASTEFQQELYPAESVSQGLKAAAKNWRTWALVLIYFSCFGGMVALTVWLPTYWHVVHGLVPTEAGKLTATFGACASLFRVAGGYLADSVSGEKACMLASLSLGGGAVMLTLCEDVSSAIIGEIFVAAGMGIGNGATFKLIPNYVPEAVGGAAGLVGGLGTFGGFALPPLLAFCVHEMGDPGYTRGFIIFIISAAKIAILSQVLASSTADSDSEDSSTEACTDEECPSAEEFSAKLMSFGASLK